MHGCKIRVVRRAVFFGAAVCFLSASEVDGVRSRPTRLQSVSVPVEQTSSEEDARKDAALHASLYDALQRGQYRLARKSLEEARRRVETQGSWWALPAEGGLPERDVARYHHAVMFAREALETRNWTAAMESPDGVTAAAIAVWFARGVGAAMAAGRGERPQFREAARTAASRLEEIAARLGRQSVAEVARLTVLASVAASEDEREEMKLLLAHALALEDARRPMDPLLDPLILPFHELAGDLWLLVDQYDDARREYDISLRRPPRRAKAVFGLAQASARAGDNLRARSAFTEFLEMWKDADADLEPLRIAREYLAQR
jgi:hypothetical protein